MNEPLETMYFEWLYAKIMLSDAPAESYSKLIQKLHNTEFVWLMPGDDNRAEDGIVLRDEFITAARLDGTDSSEFESGCSVLEMMIGFSRRAEFQTDIRPNEWFWVFIANLGLADHYDDSFDEQKVDEILYNFVWRLYEYNGVGGMFPLSRPESDQRSIEIYYQFCAYLVEKHFF